MPIDSSLERQLKESTTVDARNQQIRDGDLGDLLRIFQENPNLTKVDLSNNKITMLTSEFIDGIVAHPKLSAIKFDNNCGCVSVTVIEESETVSGPWNKETRSFVMEQKIAPAAKERFIVRSLSSEQITTVQELLDIKTNLLAKVSELETEFQELPNRSFATGFTLIKINRLVGEISQLEEKNNKLPRLIRDFKIQNEILKSLGTPTKYLSVDYPIRLLTPILKNPRLVLMLEGILFSDIQAQSLTSNDMEIFCRTISVITIKILSTNPTIPQIFWDKLLEAIELAGTHKKIRVIQIESLHAIDKMSFGTIEKLSRHVEIQITANEEQNVFSLNPQELRIINGEPQWLKLLEKILANPVYKAFETAFTVYIDLNKISDSLIAIIESLLRRVEVKMHLIDGTLTSSNRTALAKIAPQLTELHIIKTNFDSLLLKALTEAIKEASKLTTLNLTDCKVIRDVDASPFVEAVTKSPTVRELNLNGFQATIAWQLMLKLAKTSTFLNKITISTIKDFGRLDHCLQQLLKANSCIATLEINCKENLDENFPLFYAQLIDYICLKDLGDEIHPDSKKFMGLIARNKDSKLLKKYDDDDTAATQVLDQIQQQLANTAILRFLDCVSVFLEISAKIKSYLDTHPRARTFLYARANNLYGQLINKLLEDKYQVKITELALLYQLLDLAPFYQYDKNLEFLRRKIRQKEFTLSLRTATMGDIESLFSLALTSENSPADNLSKCYTSYLNFLPVKIREVKNLLDWHALITRLYNERRLAPNEKTNLLFQYYEGFRSLGMISGEPIQISHLRKNAIQHLINQNTKKSKELALTYIRSQIYHALLINILGNDYRIAFLIRLKTSEQEIRSSLISDKSTPKDLVNLMNDIITEHSYFKDTSEAIKELKDLKIILNNLIKAENNPLVSINFTEASSP